MGKIHSYETLGGLDGPGLRTVVFFQGCPMRCKYCHNPDALASDGGNEVSAEEVVAYVSRYKNYFGADGGVTLSGGDPLFQKAFCLEVMQAFKAAKINIALDTSGCIFDEKCLDLADIVLLDIKRNHPRDYKELCDYPMDNLLKTLNYLKRNKRRFWVRQVIVPGMNDDVRNVEDLCRLAVGAEKIQLLGYHTMAVEKYKELGIPYALDGMPPLDSEKLNELQDCADRILAESKSET